VRTDLRVRPDGNDGVVDVELKFDPVDSWIPRGAIIHVGNVSQSLTWRSGNRRPEIVARGSLRIAGVERWWPHTHGAPVRHPVCVEILGADREMRIDLGRIGFRTLSRRDTDDGFGIRVNDTDVFCRGACWTPLDSAALTSTDTTYREALEAVRAAGMNMVRVCGPFFYEADAFYDACDELGILVWQDYPFANMDYPGDDEAFRTTVDREVRGFLDRTQGACSLAVLCGNSEVEQQAAMVGAPRELWRSPLFSQTLAELSSELRPDVPYWPSTPSGGALPFFSDFGTAHYFGVGAYLRPLEDARRADVRFATECLAFANVPDDRAIDALMHDRGTPPQDPRWKRRTPRDGSVGWDFDDVRDYYLRSLFGVDALDIRYADVPRYLALSRVATGEVMASTFAEWRRSGSRCNGALVWFLRDLWLGAGWGVLDSEGSPKAAYYYLKRALQPTAVFLIDEGLNGLDAHIVNERPEPLDAELCVELFRGEHRVAKACTPIDARPRASMKLRTAALFDQFHDATYSYRFGPPGHDLTVATLFDRAKSMIVTEAFHFPRGLPREQAFDLGLQATATPVADGSWRVSLHTRCFAQSVFLDVKGFAALDNYVHVPPGATRDVLLRPLGASAQPPQGSARALNAIAATKLTVRD
jgi:beta-mannosidase